MHILPEMNHISLAFRVSEHSNLANTLYNSLWEQKDLVLQGGTVGIAVGSRGIHGLRNLIFEIVSFVREAGATPVILPAMGSHGGATVEGQRAVLERFGITEELGAEVVSSLHTIVLDKVEGDVPVHFDEYASQLDGIILVNRIKPHTDFHAMFESGLVKQMVVGLGNHNGATEVHSHGLSGLRYLIPQMAQKILDFIPILFGVGIIENAIETTAEVHILPAKTLFNEEPKLLEKAKQNMPFIPFSYIDLLVVQEMGKNISGVGVDSNITGRRFIRQDETLDTNKISRIVCLSLHPLSYGNALGIGMADVIPDSLYKDIDFKTTYKNVITSGFLERGFIPIVAETDYEAIQIALKSCGRKVDSQTARIVQIKNTLSLQEMFVSNALLTEEKPPMEWNLVNKFKWKFSNQGALLSKL